jgi:uncharacterized protein YjbI with pentapeptide repeats
MRGATLRLSKFKGADLRGCDLGSLSFQDAAVLKGAIISKSQATDILSGIGLLVL